MPNMPVAKSRKGRISVAAFKSDRGDFKTIQIQSSRFNKQTNTWDNTHKVSIFDNQITQMIDALQDVKTQLKL